MRVALAEYKRAKILERRRSLQSRRADTQGRLESIDRAAEKTKTLVDYRKRVENNLKNLV